MNIIFLHTNFTNSECLNFWRNIAEVMFQNVKGDLDTDKFITNLAHAIQSKIKKWLV